MPPPPEALYNTCEEALDACQAWARQHGYAITKANTKKEYKGGPYTSVFLQCDRGDTYRPRAEHRKSRTKLTGCPFRLQILRMKPIGNFRLTVHNSTHNHAPSWHPVAHAVHRRIDEGTHVVIRAETRAGVKPKQIMTRLIQETPGTAIKQKDVYNTIKKIRGERLDGKTPIEALIAELKDTDKWVFDYQTSSSGRLDYLFFAHVKTIRIFQSHPDILMADCTYKTNRFKMPLLHFIGCSSIGVHFTAAFCFMPGETEPDYQWALERVALLLYEPTGRSPKVFLSDNEAACRNACATIWPGIPKLLCLWHINKNVLDKLQKYFRQANGPFDLTEEEKAEQRERREVFMRLWNRVNFAHSEAEYEERWSAFKQEYREYTALIAYLQANQYPQRKEVAYAWTSQFRHYGNITTSKLESAHYQAKSSLLHNQGHLLDVVDKLENYWETHFREYAAKLADQYIAVYPAINAKKIKEWDDNLNEFITPYALKMCREQLNKARANEMSPTCSGRFEAVFGIPCCHDQRTWARLGQLVKPSDFDPHWLWEREGIESALNRDEAEARGHRPTIFDPAIVAAKGRPSRPRDTSIRRDSSQFELSNPDRTSRTPSRTLSQTPSISSTPALSSRASSQTPSILPSRETPNPSVFINMTGIGGQGVVSISEPLSSARSTPASIPAPHDGPNSGARPPLAQMTLRMGSTGPGLYRHPIASGMEPPAKRARTTSTGPLASASMRVAKEEAIGRVVLAWSELGQPPNIQQIQAMNSVWSPLMNTDLVASRIVTQMIMVGHQPSPAQVQALKESLRAPS